MKIIITTLLPNLESAIDPRFGRGAYFLIIDTDTLAWEALPNPATSTPSGAGIQAAQFVVDQKCEAVISGDFGPHAYNALNAAGVAMHLFGACRTVQEALNLYKSGKMEPLTAPTGAGQMHP